jgi:lipocalin-like protein
VARERRKPKGSTRDEEPKMKKLLSLGVVSLFIGMTAVTVSRRQDRSGSEGVRERFVGAWRLAWLEEEGADGKIRRADCTGLLVFTANGHMSVQVMYRNPPAGTNAAPVQYAQGGYEASFGTYEIDQSTHTFTFHVEGALVRTLIGKDLPRAFEFSGKQLIVRSTRPEEHWRVAWEHY